jgi:hypothetical protein
VCVAAFVTSVVKTAVGAPDVTLTDCVVVPCCPGLVGDGQHDDVGARRLRKS